MYAHPREAVLIIVAEIEEKGPTMTPEQQRLMRTATIMRGTVQPDGESSNGASSRTTSTFPLRALDNVSSKSSFMSKPSMMSLFGSKKKDEIKRDKHDSKVGKEAADDKRKVSGEKQRGLGKEQTKSSDDTASTASTEASDVNSSSDAQFSRSTPASLFVMADSA